MQPLLLFVQQPNMHEFRLSMNYAINFIILNLFIFHSRVNSFHHIPFTQKYLHSAAGIKITSKPLYSSNDNHNDNYRQNADVMREMLESSWKEDTMGSVPTSSNRAALNAAESILHAITSDTPAKIFMIDICLPSLDPMSGENVYDDVGAAEYLIEFAKKLNENRQSCDSLDDNGGVAIVVKDSSLLSRVKRQAKEVELYDDFADFDGNTLSQIDSNNDIHDNRNSIFPEKVTLSSMLGDNNIKNGMDMINDVVKAVATNVSLRQNEDIIIIQAPVSQQELVGVRWLVSKYSSSKTIILFNNKLNPLPNELLMAETCYSVFPLIARSSSSPQENSPEQPKNPKIVLLRRYPSDWEIYIDSNEGQGFQLADSVPASNVGQRGPSMDWIAGCVKKYMQSKFDSN